MSDYPGFEKLLNEVDWKEVEIPPDERHNDLYATHEGILKIGVFQFRVYQLNNGQRIIDKEDLDKFFDDAHWENVAEVLKKFK
jgi:hypothetical protein